MPATEIARLFARVGADISQFRSAMREVDQTSHSTGRSMTDGLGGGIDQLQGILSAFVSGGSGSLGSLISVAGTAAAAVGGITIAVGTLKKMVESGIEMQDIAQQAEITTKAYEKLAGMDVSTGARELRDATKGATSNLEAASTAMKLMSMGLAEDNAQAAKLLSISTQLARLKNPQGGGDISPLLPMLTNQSALRLDEFLVNGSAVKALQDKYEAAGMESGRAFMQAFMVEAQKTLDEVGPIEPTIKEREAATAENMQNAVASSFGGSMSAQALGGIREGWNNAKQGAADYFQQVADGQAIAAEYYKEIRGYFESGLITQEEFNAMKGGWDMWAQGAAFGLVSVETLREGLEKTLDLDGDLSRLRGLKAMRDDLSGAAAEAEHLAQRLDLIADKRVEVRVQLSYEEKLTDWARRSAEVQRWQGLASDFVSNPANLGAFGAPARDDEGMYGGGTPSNPLSAAHAAAAVRDRTTARNQPAIDRARQDAERAAQDWKSFVQGLLQPTQVTAADMAATEMGVYQDKWDESVRQFRMKEKGHNAFEIQQYEQAFYGGKMMDQVNWGDAEKGGGLIGAAREALDLKQGQQNLLNEAMKRLADAGIGMDKSQVADLLGLPSDYQQVGADRSADFLGGVKQAGMGAAVTEEFAKELDSKSGAWIEMGKSMAGWLKEGLTTSALGGSFIDAVTAQVVPKVQEALTGGSLP